MLEKFQAKRKKRFLLKAREGDLEFVSNYLNQNPQHVNITNSAGLTSLQLSSRGGHISVVSFLLHRGADVNVCTKNGNTALGFASFEGCLEVVRELVNYGANINFRMNDDTFTPLYLACQGGQPQVVDYLLKNGADPELTSKGGYRPRDIALQEKQIKCLTCLLEHQGVNDRIGPFPLHVAIKNDDHEAIQALLYEGFQVDEQSKLGFTALHYATYFDNFHLVNYCLDQDADVNLQSRVGITAVHIASVHGKKDTLSLLLDRGANPKISTTEGLTALHCAAKNGHAEEVMVLLRYGDNIEAKTLKGMTPLHLAVQGNHMECIKLLIQWKARINELNNDGLSPLHIASYFDIVSAAKLLLESGCHVNAREKSGISSLDIANKLNYKEMTKLLVEYGAKHGHDSSMKLPSYLKPFDIRQRTFTESQIVSKISENSNFSTPAKGLSERNISINNYPNKSGMMFSTSVIKDSIPLASLRTLDCSGSDLQSSLANESISSSVGISSLKA